MFQPPLRLLALSALLATIPACANGLPVPTPATAPPPAAVEPPPPAPTDNRAPPPREVKERKPIDNARAHEGRQLFLKLQCANCHTGAASTKGPNLEGLFGSKVALKGGAVVSADEAYLIESIRNPKAKVVEGWEAVMPAYNADLVTDDEVNALVAYIKGLKSGDLKPKGDALPPPVGAPTDK